MGFNWNKRHPRTPDSDYEHLFDGDEHLLTPGVDFGTINAFRVRLSRMAKARGLRFRTQVDGDRLWVQLYRVKPLDLYLETYPETDPEAVDESLVPWRAQ